MTATLDHASLVFSGCRVLRRTDRAPEIPILLAAYDETTTSLDVIHPDGVRAPTAFLRSANAVARHTKLGWKDVTALWLDPPTESVDLSEPDAETAEPAPAKSSRTTSKRSSNGRRAVRRVPAK